MHIGSRSDVQAFNATLVEAYYEGDSVATLAHRSGRSKSTIDKLIKADRVANGHRERKPCRADPRILADKKSLSPHHGWVGITISRYRAEHDLTPTSFGMLISASRVVVRNMEVGSHDFTLCQLMRLSSVLGVPFEQLVIPPRPAGK